MKKKTKHDDDNDEMRPEYNFAELGEGVRGKYAKRYREGTNLVLLEPDVAKMFPNDAAVNEALRFLMRVVDEQRSTAWETAAELRERLVDRPHSDSGELQAEDRAPNTGRI